MLCGASLADVFLLARYVMSFDQRERRARCVELFDCSEEAAFYVALTGRAHALYGDGSLSALALRKPLASMPATLSVEMLSALQLVIEQLRARSN